MSTSFKEATPHDSAQTLSFYKETKMINSTAAQIIISIIPLAGIAIGGTVVLLSVLWRHTERKMQIKSGSLKPSNFNYKAYVLLIGLLLTGIGLMLSLFFLATNGFSSSMLGGLMPFTIGVCLLIFYGINDWHQNSND